MEHDDDELSPEEIRQLRRHLADVAFRDRMRAFLMRWSGRLSAAIITGFAVYKALVDLVFKKVGS